MNQAFTCSGFQILLGTPDHFSFDLHNSITILEVEKI
jgi:hypothetical protein